MNDEHENETNDTENLIAEAIGAAEDIPDPLERLVERSAVDPGGRSRPKCWSGLQR